jgi:phosphatidylserine decarboxylase
LLQAIYRLFIELTNGRVTSGLLRRFAQSRASQLIIPSFAKVYKINQEEMEKSIKDYETLHEFFTRNMKTDVRTIDQNPDSIVSPVDAVIEDMGAIQHDHTITVKGKSYSISEMLGDDKLLQKYMDGTYIIFYLSPTDYHRIHSPISGKVQHQWTLGEKSYPVNRLGLKYGKDTLSKNYRKITEVKHERGHIAIVKVGAMFVNSIEVIHEGDELVKGNEMAFFSFGSTVVLLFEHNTFKPISDISLPMSVKMGQKIGEVI